MNYLNMDDSYKSDQIRICDVNAFFSDDCFIIYVPECKQQLKTMN
jgi:hypothetical protein